MLNVVIPRYCVNEQTYILKVILGEFLGLDFNITLHNKTVIKLAEVGDEVNLTLNADFFLKAQNNWGKPCSLPELPLSLWVPSREDVNAKLVAPEVPVIYGRPGLVRKSVSYWHLNLDIFGSAFFMLSRYEELINSDRDSHDRFPADSSIAYKSNFLDRPIINEYLEILWFCMQSLWPNLHRRNRLYRKFISCDVDHPIDLAGNSFKNSVHRVVARIIRDKNPKLALLDTLNYLFKKFDSDLFDQYRKNLYWMMSVNKRVGNIVTFNFIPLQTDSDYEDANIIRSDKISQLLKDVADAGHEVGFHPGYMTYIYPKYFKKSAEELLEVCKANGINTDQLGGRQHYLRYDSSITPALWEQNNFIYDSSLGYADKAGFRCGICYEYTMYDLVKRTGMRLKQRPLIVMDSTVISKEYEGLGFRKAAIERVKYFEELCRYYSGDFTFLWHNSFFPVPKSKSIYQSLIDR